MRVPDDVQDDGSLDGRFWLRLIGLIVAVTVASIAVVLLMGYAWYSWGLIAAMLMLGAIVGVVGLFMDRDNSHRG